MADPFRSSRLLYRAVEPSTDEPFFLTLQLDPIAYQNSNAGIAKPQGSTDAKKYMTNLEEALLGVVICLPPNPTTEAHPKPIPIGAINLSHYPARLAHHRTTEIGIDIIQPYQGQGYGSEAIRWVLGWAFDTAGLHRVEIRTFEFNAGARKLYERLGFTLEGRSRERIWCKGRFWDDFQFGMLESDWRELTKARGE